MEQAPFRWLTMPKVGELFGKSIPGIEPARTHFLPNKTRH